MKDYKDFDSIDFVTDGFFRQWVLAPDPETEIFWQNWLAQHPEKSEKIQGARQVVLALRVKQFPLSEATITAAVQETVTQFNSKQLPMLTPLNWYRQNWGRLAAAVLVLLLSTLWLYDRYAVSTDLIYKYQIANASDTLVEKVNNQATPLNIRLSDNSIITLHKGSKISYSPLFEGATRSVYLSGEAFFDIAKDPNKPFLVYANGLVTKVLGTSFRIKALSKSPEVSVEVATGRVSVFTSSDPDIAKKATNRELDGIVLKPNQRVVFNRQEVRLAKFIVEMPELVKSELLDQNTAPNFEFSDTPIPDVFTTLEENYNIDIIYDEDLMKNCPLTASLTNQPFFEKLSIICKAIEARYEVLDGQVVVYGKGCK